MPLVMALKAHLGRELATQTLLVTEGPQGEGSWGWGGQKALGTMFPACVDQSNQGRVPESRCPGEDDDLWPGQG